MMNKMAARDLSYTQGQLSYGDSQRNDNEDCILSLRLVYGKWVF